MEGDLAKMKERLQSLQKMFQEQHARVTPWRQRQQQQQQEAANGGQQQQPAAIQNVDATPMAHPEPRAQQNHAAVTPLSLPKPRDLAEAMDVDTPVLMQPPQAAAPLPPVSAVAPSPAVGMAIDTPQPLAQPSPAPSLSLTQPNSVQLYPGPMDDASSGTPTSVVEQAAAPPPAAQCNPHNLVFSNIMYNAEQTPCNVKQGMVASALPLSPIVPSALNFGHQRDSSAHQQQRETAAAQTADAVMQQVLSSGDGAMCMLQSGGFPAKDKGNAVTLDKQSSSTAFAHAQAADQEGFEAALAGRMQQLDLDAHAGARGLSSGSTSTSARKMKLSLPMFR